jgi:hypothetical protein
LSFTTSNSTSYTRKKDTHIYRNNKRVRAK